MLISKLLWGEIPPNSQIPPKILRHVINYTLNINISSSKFALFTFNIAILE